MQDRDIQAQDQDIEIWENLGRYERSPLTIETAQQYGLSAELPRRLAYCGAVLYLSHKTEMYFCQVPAQADQDTIEKILTAHFRYINKRWESWGKEFRILVSNESTAWD